MRQLMVLTAILAGCSAGHQCQRSIVYPADEERMTTVCGEPYAWTADSFPIHVYSTLSPEYADEAASAVDLWNNLVGREFLEWDENEPFSDNGTVPIYGAIRIVQAELGEDGETETRFLGLADTNANDEGQIRSALIRLDYGVEHHLLRAVVMHELGHALGLRHDPTDPRSQMFPLTWDPNIQRLSSRDILAVQERVPFSVPTIETASFARSAPILLCIPHVR